MNRILLLITTVSVLLAAASLAQQSDDVSFEQEDTSAANDDAPERVQQPEEAQPEVNPDAIFTPTEEISEDDPVAFPVDI